MTRTEETQTAGSERGARLVHFTILAVLHLVMIVELILLMIDRQWMHAFLVVGIMAAMLLPILLKPRLAGHVPHEVQIFVIGFVFATLFLGEVRDYYERFWWWDLLLHGTAGLLLGILGFMIVYVLNENERVDMHMRPSFLALFAFCFSQAIGAIWEIFEFAMDELFGLTMQKPMLGDASGLTDTMWDLIVNAIGAAIISVAGWRYLRRVRTSPLESWSKRFIDRNPRLFGD
jgi:hypothetical protein